MKKRIEQDDVIYTIDENSGDCIDIDVKPGVNEVSFEASFARKYLFRIKSGNPRLFYIRDESA